MASLLSASLSLLSNAVPQSVGSLVTPVEGRQPSATQVLSQAALSVPKTLYNRFTGTPEHPEWAMHEEVIFNAVRIVATHAEAAHPSSRTMVTRLMNLQSRLCSEKITQVSTYYDEDDVKGYWIGKPVDMSKDIVMVYLHGGSFITGHPLQACHALADLMTLLRKEKKLESRIYAVEYPLAPEQPYPAGLNSCVRAVQWIIDAVGAKNIVLVGDSAGGNLTLATLLRLRDHFPHAHYIHKILGCVAISPYVDFLGPRVSPDPQKSHSTVALYDERAETGPKDEDGLFGTTTDFLGLNAGRCAVRYYLGTKGLRWYKAVGAWPNPWDKSQWDGNWLKDWDHLLGLAARPDSTTESTSRPPNPYLLAKSMPPLSYLGSRLAEHQEVPRILPEIVVPRRSSISRSGQVEVTGVIPANHPDSPSHDDADDYSTLIDEATSSEPSVIGAREPSYPSAGTSSLRGGSFSPRSILSSTPSRKRLSFHEPEAIADHDIIGSPTSLRASGSRGQTARARRFASGESSGDYGYLSSGAETSEPNMPRAGRRQSGSVSRSGSTVKRYSFIADRMVNIEPGADAPQVTGVPFPNMASLKTPYYLNYDLSNYDLERIYITLALSPYVSPYRARSWDNLPPILFMVGQKESVYNDVMKCVKKARKSIVAAEARVGPDEKAMRPRGFGRVDVMDRPLGVHVYLLLPEVLVRGKGMEGLRDISNWIDMVYQERIGALDSMQLVAV